MVDLAGLQAVAWGRVHGVFYRAFVQRRAEELKLTGYVRNRPDGTVEVKAEGDRANLEKLVEYMKAGPPAAKVEEVKAQWVDYTGSFTSFNIRY